MTQKTSLILFLLKKNSPDFSTLARMQRERGYNAYSQPIPYRPLSIPEADRLVGLLSGCPSRNTSGSSQDSAKHLCTHSSSDAPNGI